MPFTAEELRRKPVTKAGILATGVRGRIMLRQYYPAADVGGFIVERDAQGALTLRAHVANADDYKLGLAPLYFVVTLTRGSWCWPITEVCQYRDHAFTARLAEPEAKERKVDAITLR